jgi:hypothetical protein
MGKSGKKWEKYAKFIKNNENVYIGGDL